TARAAGLPFISQHTTGRQTIAVTTATGANVSTKYRQLVPTPTQCEDGPSCFLHHGSLTREIFWLPSTSSWEATTPNGPTCDAKARWAQTVAQAKDSRRRNARAFAQILTDVD